MKDKNTFTTERLAELEKMPIDTTDIPALTEEQKKALFFKNWRPVKKTITIQIDMDTLQRFKTPNPKGYQSRINDALRWALDNGYTEHRA